MIIGLDFDNTIVSYDEVFYNVAIEWGIAPSDIPANKLEIRNFLRDVGKEDRWTEMQGYVYGTRMEHAQIFPGFIEFLRQVKNDGFSVVIVSHKTPHPYRGPKYDLHAAAREWIEKNICLDGVPVLSAKDIFFEPTKEKKIERIAELGCDVFIDDLPEIIFAADFPKKVRAILFDPDSSQGSLARPGVRVLSSWPEIQFELGMACR